MKSLITLLHNFHNEYVGNGIGPLPEYPHDLFEKWISEAINVGCQESSAMHLATIGLDGYPKVRTVLFKGFQMDEVEEEGSCFRPTQYLTFYTNYESNKGLEIRSDSRVAVEFFWPEIFKSVRVVGNACKNSVGASIKYWDGRPKKSKIAAIVSKQSKPIASRNELLTEFALAEGDADYVGNIIPKPSNWGGYLIYPISFEFWQGRLNRLHERVKYTFDPHDGKLWHTEILQP